MQALAVAKLFAVYTTLHNMGTHQQLLPSLRGSMLEDPRVGGQDCEQSAEALVRRHTEQEQVQEGVQLPRLCVGVIHRLVALGKVDLTHHRMTVGPSAPSLSIGVAYQPQTPLSLQTYGRGYAAHATMGVKMPSPG